MNANDVRIETRGFCEWNGFSKFPRSGFDLMALGDKSFRERFEKRNVRRICKIDPETHWRSPLDLDQLAAFTQGLFGCFNHVHHPQSGGSICLWLFVVLNAVDEMQRFGL